MYLQMTETGPPFQVHVPFALLRGRHLAKLIERRLNPEIAFNHSVLDETDRAVFLDIAARLVASGLRITFHAPFLDLRPGALDGKVRQLSVDRIKQVFDLVPYFQPQRVVCHPSFDAKYYPGAEEQWLENSLATWGYFTSLAAEMGTVVALENVYEKDPTLLERLLSALNSTHACFCLDTGHFNVFARTPLEEWLATLGPYLGQIHVHDNHGQADLHLPLGEGNFPFEKISSHLRRQNGRPIITLEAHSEEHLLKSVKNFHDFVREKRT